LYQAYEGAYGLGARAPYGDGLGARGGYGDGLGARGAYGDGLGARYKDIDHLEKRTRKKGNNEAMPNIYTAAPSAPCGSGQGPDSAKVLPCNQ